MTGGCQKTSRDGHRPDSSVARRDRRRFRGKAVHEPADRKPGPGLERPGKERRAMVVRAGVLARDSLALGWGHSQQ